MNKFATLSLLVLSVQSITFNQQKELVQLNSGSTWEEGQLPWHDQVEFFDKNDGDISYHTGKFVAAAKGSPITNKMEAKAAAAAKAAEEKMYYPFKPSSHDHDDTGSGYFENWKCFGVKCPDPSVVPGDKRKYLS